MLKVNRTVIVLTLCTLACGQSAVQRSDGASTPVASPASMPAASPTASIASLNVIKRTTFKVHSGLPPYTFNLVGKREKGKVIINGIEVTRDDDPSITQSLRVSSDITPLREDLDYFRSEDINFDGYEDISLLTNVAMVNSNSDYWVFNPEEERFRYLGNFATFEVDAKKRELTTYNRGGHAGLIWFAEKYKFINGVITLVRTEEQNWDEKKERYIKTMKELKNEKMVVTSKRTFSESEARPGASW